MTGTDASPDPETEARRRWMGILAQAPTQALERAWTALAAQPGYDLLRPPEVGLALVRGRVGGTGQPFNLGEMTLTRCSVRLDDGSVGHAYVSGRCPRHAELAAVFDALMSDPGRRDALNATLIEPEAAVIAERREHMVDAAAATRVEFFTMSRGDS